MDTSTLSHNEYYAQFVTTDTFNMLQEYIGLKSLLASEDIYFNNIALAKWDRLPRSYNTSEGKTFSLSDHVCICKTAARLMVENAKRL